MTELYFLVVLVLNLITAYVFFKLGRTGDLPKIKIRPSVKQEEQEKSNFKDEDLQDIRDVDPQKIVKSFMQSIKKPAPNTDLGKTAEDFQEFIN